MDAMISSLLTQLNTSKVFAGISMLMLNVGSRYVVADISASQERMLSNWFAKRIILFCMLFVATRDVLVAACMTTALVILSESILNETSPFCLLPKDFLSPPKAPSLIEYQKARHIVKSFEDTKTVELSKSTMAATGIKPAVLYFQASAALGRAIKGRV